MKCLNSIRYIYFKFKEEVIIFSRTLKFVANNVYSTRVKIKCITLKLTRGSRGVERVGKVVVLVLGQVKSLLLNVVNLLLGLKQVLMNTITNFEKIG